MTTDEEFSSSERAILRQLQRAFKTAEVQLSVWHNTLNSVQSAISAVVNQCEQYTCCRQADFSSTALAPYTDLQTRLCNKLITSIESNTEKLRAALSSLEQSQVRVRDACTETDAVYGCHGDELSGADLCHATPTWPPLCTMLEWNTDINVLFSHAYCSLLCTLNNLDYTKQDTVNSLATQWKGCHKLAKDVRGILCQTQYLKEEKF